LALSLPSPYDSIFAAVAPTKPSPGKPTARTLTGPGGISKRLINILSI
jgi:hypothetical protein